MGFKKLYADQIKFQDKVEQLNGNVDLPIDNPVKFQYHVTGLQEEIGEVLKADKRWKTHRNITYDRAEKLDEISDCYISLMNMSIWSGFTDKEILGAIKNKIKVNNERINR